MLETVQSMSLLAIMEIVGPVLLAIALIYAIVQWSRRSRATKLVSDEATRHLYREGEREKEVDLEHAAASSLVRSAAAPIAS
jgi:hypothetical protein